MQKTKCHLPLSFHSTVLIFQSRLIITDRTKGVILICFGQGMPNRNSKPVSSTQPDCEALNNRDKCWLQGYFTSHSNLFLADITVTYSVLNGPSMSPNKIMHNRWNKSPIRSHLEEEQLQAKFLLLKPLD